MAGIQNITAVQQRLQREKNVRLQKLTLGLKEAGLYLLRASLKIVPVDYGNLKASGFTRCEAENTTAPEVIVGYTALYAVFVHEDLEAKHGAQFNAYYAQELAAAKKRQRKGGRSTGPFRHNRGEGQQAKFLEQPFRLLRNTLMLIVGLRVRS